MSADFLSICATMPPETAHRLHRELSSREWCGSIVGPDDATLLDPSRNPSPDWAAIAAAHRGKRPPVASLQGAHVEIGVGTMESISGESALCEMPMSTGIPSLSAVDRVLGIPRGNPILGGHAVVRVSVRHRAAFARAWQRLLDDAGGEKRAAGILAPYLERYGNGRDDAAAVFSAVGRVLGAATGDVSLVFVCCPVP